MEIEIQVKLWKYLSNKLKKLDDWNYTARLIFNKVSKLNNL